MSELFRTEALAHQGRAVQGEVIVGIRLPWLVLGYIMIGAIFVIVIVACLAKYDRKEQVAGVLVPQAGIIRVTAQQGGVITGIEAGEGQALRSGEALATLRLAVDGREGNSGQLLEQAAENEQTAMRQSNQAAIEKVEADHETLLRRQAALQSQYDETARLKTVLAAKQAVADRNLTRARELSQKGFLSPRGLDDAVSASLDAQQAVVTANTNLLSLGQQLADVRSDLAETPILLNQARSNALSADASMRQKLEQVRSASAYTVTTPVDAEVMTIAVKPGQAVVPGATVAILTPQNSALEAELYVPTRGIGFVRPGQEVFLQYDAFSYKKFGSAKGCISAVSHSPLTPAEAAASGVSPAEPVFRVRVALERDYVFAYGARRPLQPGMLLSANIIIERRSVVGWLLDPLYAVTKRQ